MANIVDVLNDRGLLEDITSPDLRKAAEASLVVYAGFDPTSDSLQAGNLAAIMVLAHFQRAGHRVVAVVGGATGMIGDPSGKDSERSLLSSEQVAHNAVGIQENLSRFLDFDHPTAPARIVNNNDWFTAFTFVDFLRDVGKHFRMGTMLGKESVRARLNSEGGMSFAEFSYQLLQAYDFLRLYDEAGCTVQIGGSDQWGNITAGIDLIRRLRNVEAFGLTIPLVCDGAGQKFGKSEGNAVFLDRRKTSCYDLYQFFVRTSDVDAIRFLKIFTFLPLPDIEELDARTRAEPEKRAAQRRLAEAVVRNVHGDEGLEIARRASSVMFGESMEGLCAEDLIDVFATVPSTELALDTVVGALVVDVAARCGLCRSKGEARRLVDNRGLYLNNRRVEDPGAVVAASDIVDGRLLVLRGGKKHFHLVRVS